MKYKVGDRVRIKNLDWYNRHTNGTEIDCGGVPFTSGMKWFCSCVMTISFVHADCYDMVEDLENYYTDEMIEGLAEEEDLIPKFGEYSDNEPLDVPTMTTDFVKEHGLPCPKGYIFKDENGNVINATKIVLEKKKKEYPKTYEECEKILGLEDSMIKGCLGYEYKLLNTFQKLLMCRDAYWKIAGEEMGLGKPWKPDYENPDIDLYVIINIYNRVEKEKYGYGFQHCIFTFPTEEMRDAFYENFKEEIKICKELL